MTDHDLNRDTGGTSLRRGAQGDPWRRERGGGEAAVAARRPCQAPGPAWGHCGNDATVIVRGRGKPDGFLCATHAAEVAGWPDAHLLTFTECRVDREYLELRVEPELVTRRLDVDDRPSPKRATAWILVAVGWGAFIVALALLIGHIARELDAAPRSAPDPTPAGSHGPESAGPAIRVDVSTEEGPSGRGPSGAPHAGDGQRALEPVGAPSALDPRVGREGDIAHSGSRRPYVAIPLGPGIHIRVCGPAACIEDVVSTDAGPDREKLLEGRIMDLDVTRWEKVCGMQARFGLCPGSWVRVTGAQPRVTPPPTSTGGE